MDAFDISLREQLARYLAGETTLQKFREWFVPAVWNLTAESQLLSPVTRRVELRLAEYLNGSWSEDDLKSLFTREAQHTEASAP